MLKQRIIPLLLLKNGRMVKTVQFDNWRDVGDPVTAARVYDAQRADELIFLDISASTEKRQILLDVVAAAARECFMPLCVGGGVRTLQDIRALFNSGADKVAINTAAVENPAFIKAAAEKFGSSNIVVSIDVRKQHNRYEVFSHGGTVATGREAVAWATEATHQGAGEILITAIDREGTMTGLDLELTSAVSSAVQVPVIASGGVGSLADFAAGFTAGKASAVAAGSIFHFTDQSPIMTRNYLYNNGLPVRP